LSILFAVCFIALAVSFVTYYQYRKSLPSKADPAAASTAAVPAVKQSSIARFIEVTGFRVSENEKQKAQVDFVVVNHSGADIPDLGGTVTLKAVASNADQEPVATFEFKLKSLGPYEAKDMKLPIQTKMRAYELPDWQFLKADVQITSPQ
jgi:hypothetical protein